LLDVWFVHFLAAFLSIAGVLVLIAASEVRGTLGIVSVYPELLDVLVDVIEAFRFRPWWTVPLAIGIILGVEAVFPAIALLVMPWGARDEPLRASYRNALRQTWLRTAHVIPCVILVGTLAVAYDRVETEWRNANPFPVWSPPPPPAMASDDPGYEQAMADYDATIQRYQAQLGQTQQAWNAWLNTQPWYIEYGPPLIVATGLVMALWMLWALLRAVGAQRQTAPIVRPPMCEACGYNLTTIPMESRCPECGEPVPASLGPTARSGTSWQRRREIGRWRAWWECSVAAVRHPRELGRQLPVTADGTDHRRFLALHLPVIFCITFASAAGAAVINAPTSDFREMLPIFLLAFSALGCLCVGGTVVFTLAGTIAIGVFESLRYRRNLLPGAMQVACYLGGYLTLWALFGGATAVIVFAMEEERWFHILEQMTGVYRDTLSTSTWLIPNLVWCVTYFVLLARGTAGTQYANR
jgi:hypothetical protein